MRIATIFAAGALAIAGAALTPAPAEARTYVSIGFGGGYYGGGWGGYYGPGNGYYGRGYARRHYYGGPGRGFGAGYYNRGYYDRGFYGRPRYWRDDRGWRGDRRWRGERRWRNRW